MKACFKFIGWYEAWGLVFARRRCSLGFLSLNGLYNLKKKKEAMPWHAGEKKKKSMAVESRIKDQEWRDIFVRIQIKIQTS